MAGGGRVRLLRRFPNAMQLWSRARGLDLQVGGFYGFLGSSGLRVLGS